MSISVLTALQGLRRIFCASQWTAIFQYLLLAKDSSNRPSGEAQSLLEAENASYITATFSTEDVGPVEDNRLKEAISRALLSPPFLTVLLATSLAFVSNKEWKYL